MENTGSTGPTGSTGMSGTMKLVVGVLATALLIGVPSYMYAQGLKKKKAVDDKKHEDETKHILDTTVPKDPKDAVLAEISKELATSTIDVFEGRSVQDMKKLNLQELKELLGAIKSQKKFAGERAFLAGDPKSYAIIAKSFERVTGRYANTNTPIKKPAGPTITVTRK